LNYGIEAIPTKYKNIQFRSRLEATWACFFDKLGWDWTYEPFDLNGWIPDFAISGYNKDPILVEVKPISSFNKETAEKISRACIETQYEILLVGINLIEASSWDVKALGWIHDFGGDTMLCDSCEKKYRDCGGSVEEPPLCNTLYYEAIRNCFHEFNDPKFEWERAVLGCFQKDKYEKNPTNKRIGFSNELQSWQDRITGNHDSCPYGRVLNESEISEKVTQLFAEAKNEVQYSNPNWTKPKKYITVKPAEEHPIRVITSNILSKISSRKRLK
jgi:hypothetical protein